MPTNENNPYCRALGIDVPRVEDVVERRAANNFGLLVTALVERGGPMTLEQVAQRFEDAGVASFERALASLRRSRPATRPIYRDGDLYELDPHDSEARAWILRLGLGRRNTSTRATPPEPAEPLPGPEVRLSLDELDDAFRGASLRSWSAQRLAVAILDAHGQAMEPERVVAQLSARTEHHSLSADTSSFERRNAAVGLDEDGRWALAAGHDALRSAREAVRARVAKARARAAEQTSPAQRAARREAYEAARAAEFAWLAAASHALLHAFPPEQPRAVVLADLEANTTQLFMPSSFDDLRERLFAFDFIAGVDVRALLRRLDFDPGERRLPELGPPQKTRKLSKRGRSVELTTEMIIRSSCGIMRPLTPETTLTKHLMAGKVSRLRAALESDLSSLRALYEYGRLHGFVRLRWRQYEDRLPLGWSRQLDSALGVMCSEAIETGRELEVVVEPITDWERPWAQSKIVSVERGLDWWSTIIVDELGRELDRADIQLARWTDETSSREDARPRLLALVPDDSELSVLEPPTSPEPPPGGGELAPVELFVGGWRITDMQRWDADYYDMQGPAHLSIEAVQGQADAARGQFRFGLVWAEMDCRCELREGEPMLRFSWVGDDEGEPMSGRGWISVTPTEMRGQICFHFGDDSTFAARRIARPR